MTNKLIRLIHWMTIEEWRLHSTLFGGRRFTGFPLILSLLAATAAFALSHLNTNITLLTNGVVLLAAVLGLQTGSISFESNDAIKNLLGDITLLIYSSRTLPISGRDSITAFIIKDLGYYAGLFLLPITTGVILGAWAETIVFSAGSMTMCVNCGGLETYKGWQIALIWVQTWVLSSVAFLGGLGVAITLSNVALSVRAIGKSRASTNTQSDQYSRASAAFGNSSIGGLAVKTVLDVHRSSGGIWKLVLSSLMLLGSVYVVLELVSQHIPITPSYGVLFGTLLSVTTFPTYTWLTRIDSPDDYRFYPVTTTTLVRAKALAFIILQSPVLVTYYILSLTVFPSAMTDVLSGTFLLLGLSVFLFGLTVQLTGFKPSEFMFDSVVFAKYSGLAMTALFPPLLYGLFFQSTLESTAIIGSYGVLFGVVGGWLFNRTSAGME